jgi:CHAD domain-containing protein
MSLDVKRIEKSVRKLRKVLKKAPKHMNPKKVHDLRTRARRIEAVLEAFSRKSVRNERRVLKHLAQIRRRTGKVRDMDVFSMHLSNADLKSEREALVLLLEYLGAKRYRQARKLHAWMKRKGPTARRRLKKMASRLDKRFEKTKKRTRSNAALTADAIATGLTLSAALATPPNLQPANLHEYRIKIKDLRDVLQSVEHSDQNNKFIEALGRSKDAIGEWHDWEELVRIAGKVLKRVKHTRLIGELKKISQRKYHQALSVTNKMRDECIEGEKESSKQLRKPKQKSVTPSLQVVKAMTA